MTGSGARKTRLRDLHAADRVAVEAWWDAQQRVAEVRRRGDRVRDSGRGAQARVAGGMTARQVTAAQRAVNGAVRPTSDAARRRHLRLAAIGPELAEVRARAATLSADVMADLAAAESALADAAAAMAASVPWAAELAALAGRASDPDQRSPQG